MNTDRKTTDSADAMGRQLARVLDDAPLPEGVEARLRAARETAVQAAAAARESRVVLAPALAGTAGSTSGRGQGRWTLIALALVLAVGLLAIGQSQWMQQVMGRADADAALLKDTLPPTAYGDPGFNEYLDEKPEGEAPPPEETETTDR